MAPFRARASHPGRNREKQSISGCLTDSRALGLDTHQATVSAICYFEERRSIGPVCPAFNQSQLRFVSPSRALQIALVRLDCFDCESHLLFYFVEPSLSVS